MKTTKNLIIGIVFASAFFAVGKASAATYYVDYVGGSDSNSGSSKSAPWKTAPGMVGFSGSYTHASGDAFVFKGGVSWPSSTLPLSVGYSGIQDNADKYFTDKNWYTGANYSAPVFDGGGADNVVVNISDKSHVILDGIKFYNYASGNAYVHPVQITGNTTNITVLNCSWVPTYAPSGAMLIQAGGGKTIRNITIKNNDMVGYGENNIVLVRSNYGIIDGVVFGNNTIHHDPAGGAKQDDGIHLQTTTTDDWYRNIDIYGNTFYENTQKSHIIVEGKNENVSIHENTFYGNVSVAAIDIGQDVGPGPGKNLLIYNNIFRDISWVDVGTWRGFAYIWIFNQNQYPESTTGYIANNVFVGTKIAGERMIHIGNGAGDNSNMIIENNIFTDAETAIEVDSGQLSGRISNNLYYNNITDLKNAVDNNKKVRNPLFVDKINHVFSLNSGSPAIDSGVQLLSLFSSDFLGIVRPQGSAWDIGAYEYQSQTPPPTPVTYSITDFTNLVTDWLKTIASPADLNKDGTVNTKDLGIMMSNWK